MIDSMHRVRYPGVVAARDISPMRADVGNAQYFDPLRAAAWHWRHGNVDEACWIIFLFVHFGKHARGGYRYLRDVYGRLGDQPWHWPVVGQDPTQFVAWLEKHHIEIQTQRGPGGFGNHRKYESLRPEHTGRTVETYVAWVQAAGGHQPLFAAAIEDNGVDYGVAFESLYVAMNQVHRFGRTARFDYLTMLYKLGITPIAPSSVHLAGATGPRDGVRLLYGAPANVPNATLESWVQLLDGDLQLGPLVLEDALCNWQKSPTTYRAFRG
jgi:hypothetical protein